MKEEQFQMTKTYTLCHYLTKMNLSTLWEPPEGKIKFFSVWLFASLFGLTCLYNVASARWGLQIHAQLSAPCSNRLKSEAAAWPSFTQALARRQMAMHLITCSQMFGLYSQVLYLNMNIHSLRNNKRDYNRSQTLIISLIINVWTLSNQHILEIKNFKFQTFCPIFLSLPPSPKLPAYFRLIILL